MVNTFISSRGCHFNDNVFDFKPFFSVLRWNMHAFKPGPWSFRFGRSNACNFEA